MKKIISVLLTAIIMLASFLALTANAWSTPKLMLAALYDSKKQSITLYYRVLDFAGTESADFRLKFASDVVEMTNHKETKIADTLMEVDVSNAEPNIAAIQFIDMYHVNDDDCEEDGSATIVTFTFSVKDTSAEKISFIAYADSCNMDPDSAEVVLDRATLQLPLNSGSVQKATVEGYEFPDGIKLAENEAVSADTLTPDNNKKFRFVIIGAVVAAVVFVIALIVIVRKYRKQEPDEN